MNEIKNALCSRALRGVILVALSLAGVQVAHAGFKNGQWSSGWNVDWDRGVMQPSPQWMPAGSPSSGNTRWGVEGGLPVAKSAGRLPVGKGVIDVEAKVLPNRPSVAGAIGKLGRKLSPIGMALAWYDFFDEIGYIMNEDGTVSRPNPDSCSVEPCKKVAYKHVTGHPWVYYYDPSTSCSAYTAYYNSTAGSGWQFSNPRVVGGDWPTTAPTCQVDTFQYGVPKGAISISYTSTQSAPVGGGDPVPSSWDDVEQTITDKTDWSPTSKLPEIIKQAADSGEPIDASSPTITGPSSVPGPTSTTQNPDGSTTTKQTTYNISYSGNQISYTTTNITTITNNGQPVSTTTETIEDDHDPDQCEAYPDSVGCSSLDTPEGDIPKVDKNITFTPENLGFGGGVCPADKFITVHRMAQPIKVFDWQDTCGKLQTYARPMIITLATFAALMIIFSVRVD